MDVSGFNSINNPKNIFLRRTIEKINFHFFFLLTKYKPDQI